VFFESTVQPGRAISNRYCRGVFFGNVARPNVLFRSYC